jgi:iron complex outermembrane receptor protein
MTFRTWHLAAWGSAAALLIFSGAAFAQQRQPDNQVELFEMPIEELMKVPVVFSASKYEQKASEAPASVSIITADEIKKYGYRTVADILRSVGGFYTTYDRNYTYLGVRGFGRDSEHVLMLINGHRINENIIGRCYVATEFHLDVDLIDRIEIIRGPGSSLYGENAFFAVINIITKQAKDYKGLELSGELASFGTERSRITYGNILGKDVELLVSATTFDQDGQKLYFKEFDDPETNNGWVRNDDDQFHNLFTRLSAGDFDLTVASVSREKGIPTGSWGAVFEDSRNRTWDDFTLVGLTYNHSFSDTFSIKGRAAYNQFKYYGEYVYDYDPDMVVNKDYLQGRWWEGELQFVAQPFARHKITWGAEYRYNARQDQRNWDEEVYLNDRRHSKNWGVYVQDEFKIWDNLSLVAGVRHDGYETFGGTTSPRLGVIYNPFEKTTLKLLYGEAFRAASVYELYYNDGDFTIKANPDLKPETIKNYEIVLEQRINQHIRGTISGFYCKMENFIDRITDPADGLMVYENIDEVNAKGLEAALDSRWDNGLQGRASYSLVQTENEQTGRSLTNSPRHLAKLNLIAPLIKNKLFAGIETQYTSEAKTLSGRYAGDFAVVNLTLTCVEVAKGLEVSASVYNLFDKKYGNPGFAEHVQDVIYQDGRRFAVRLTYRF